FAGLFGDGFFGSDLDDLGREKVHFLHPADGLILVGDFEGTLGFLPPLVHRHVVVLWHKRLSLYLLGLKGICKVTAGEIRMTNDQDEGNPNSKSQTLPFGRRISYWNFFRHW